MAFSHALSVADFSDIPSLENVNDMCSAFYCHLREAMACIPSTYVTLSKNDKPWITPVLKSLINKRWNAYRNKQWHLFTHYKFKIKNEIRKAKLVWTQRQINSSRNVWKVVNEVRGKNNTDCFSALIRDHRGIDTFLSMVQDYLSCNFNHEKDAVMPFEDDELWSFHVSISEVHRALKKLKVSKSCGSDDIPNRLLREGADWLSWPLYHIFVKSVKDRVFPDVWKLANVTLVPKCKRPSINNLRPVSLTPVISKIFEKFVLNSVRPHLLPLFGPNQYALRRHGSTESALIRMHDSITTYLDDPNIAAVRLTCLDLTKAFDRLQHSILLNRLISGGVNAGFILWLRSYLENRTQRLKLHDSFGPITKIPSGVPQGSIIGPILFAACMGTLVISSDSALVIYADDITLIEPIFKQEQKSSYNLKSVQEWIKRNNMSINIKKSTQMIFYRSKNEDFSYPNIDVCQQIKILSVVQTHLCLGVLIMMLFYGSLRSGCM